MPLALNQGGPVVEADRAPRVKASAQLVDRVRRRPSAEADGDGTNRAASSEGKSR